MGPDWLSIRAFLLAAICRFLFCRLTHYAFIFRRELGRPSAPALDVFLTVEDEGQTPASGTGEISMTAGWFYFSFIVLCLVHMQEEYRHGFAYKFPPPRLAGRVADRVFWIVNPLLLSIATAVGVANLMGAPWAFFWVALWSALCVWNGIAHGIWSITTRTYQPGLITGLLYLPVFALWTWLLTSQPDTDWAAYRLALFIGLAMITVLASVAYFGRRFLR